MPAAQIKRGRHVAALTYTPWPFSEQEFIAAEGATSADAYLACTLKARSELGWTPPRRWQWWRRDDFVEPRVTAMA